MAIAKTTDHIIIKMKGFKISKHQESIKRRTPKRIPKSTIFLKFNLDKLSVGCNIIKINFDLTKILMVNEKSILKK